MLLQGRGRSPETPCPDVCNLGCRGCEQYARACAHVCMCVCMHARVCACMRVCGLFKKGKKSRGPLFMG